MEKQPPPPDAWVDQLADTVVIRRLLSMGVLQRKKECQDEVSSTLTTRFVYDWRIKDHRNGSKMWMRRSRFVAHEFAADRRHDTHSPASGCHSARCLQKVAIALKVWEMRAAINTEWFWQPSTSKMHFYKASGKIGDGVALQPTIHH